MNTSSHNDANPPFHVADTLESARDAALDISGAGGAGSADDIVPAEVVADSRPCRKGRQGAALRRGTEKKRVKGYLTRKRLIELHVFGGKRLSECAREMGISGGRAYAVWKGVVAEANGGKGEPEEHQRAVRTYLDHHFRRVIEESQKLLGEAAAYGAAVIAAGKALSDLHGVAGEQVASSSVTLSDVGREVRIMSPLLMDKLEQIRSMGGVVNGRATDDSPIAAPVMLGGVPVDGLKEGDASSAGVPSPLLSACSGDKLAHALERTGERAVRCARINGAEVAMDSIPKAMPGRPAKRRNCGSESRSPFFSDEDTKND